MSDSVGDQIHDATPTRQQQARRDGDIAKSFELAAGVQMIGAIAAAYLAFGQIGNWMRNLTTTTWGDAGTNTSIDSAVFTDQMQSLIFSSLGVLAPLMALLLFVGVGSHWLQTGPLFLADKIAPDPTRLASGNWWKHIFSMSGLAYVIVGIPKTLLALATLGASSYVHRNEFFALANYPIDTMVGNLFSLVLTIVLHVALVMVVVSIADYWLKRMSHQKRMRMTDQQLRDELRMQNGDPRVRAQQRKMGRSGPTSGPGDRINAS